MYDKSAKSLRWLANQFPAVETPKDDTDRISTCIHLYCAAGADAIDTLTAQLAALQAENAEKDREISRAEAERDEARQDCAVTEENHRKAIEERDAAVELLRRLPESCCGCKYAVDGEACQCSECDDADTENCTETCPWWGDPCGLCDDKDSWSFCGAQGEG